LGRAAISNPWALARISAAMRGEPEPPHPTSAERIEVALEHLRSLAEIEGDEARACRHLRGQIPLYIKGYPGAAQARARLSLCSTIAEYEDVLSDFASRCSTEEPCQGRR
jgi:tRNA-dihydrouridine synthase